MSTTKESSTTVVPRPARRWRRRTALLGLLGFFPLLGWLALPLVPLPDGLAAKQSPSIIYLDRHAHPLREQPNAAERRSQPVAWQQLPESLVNATLAAEDKRFWSHPGVDWRATLRSAWLLARHGRIVSGGSTITQQLIKLASPRQHHRTFAAKLVEAAQALRLEQVWEKQRILTEYLNRIDYGNLNTGCAAAARCYFGKPVSELTTAESAFLAGLPQAPTRLNPYHRLEPARRRQQWVLERMRVCQWLGSDDFTRARQEPLRLAARTGIFEAPHFIEIAMRTRTGAPEADRPGSRCTTLDLRLQREAELVLRHHLRQLASQHGRDGAVVILDNLSGDVLALVGSEDFFDPRAGQVNGAWAPRSAGSTLKPFTYLLAFEKGASPAQIVADVPTEYHTATGRFAPVNYEHHCSGPISYRHALANSLNIPAVRILDSVGGPAALQERLRACGLTTLSRTTEHYGLGLTLGNAEVRLLELANAYATLARLGEFKPYRLHRDERNPAAGSNTKASPSPTHRVFAAGPAWLVADVLSDNAARTLVFGIDSPLRFDFPVACKTGTSSDFRDNWAVGYTPEFTVAVWVGNFDGSPMQRVSGISGAAPILHELFVHLHTVAGTSWYAPPQELAEGLVHPLTGKLSNSNRPSLVRERFLTFAPPSSEQPSDYDADGRVLLSEEYRAWFAGPDNAIGHRACMAPLAAATSLHCVSPLPGAVYFLDPDLPPSSQCLPLRARGGSQLEWHSDTLQCVPEGHGFVAKLRPGIHRLIVRDPTTNKSDETWIEVRRL